MIKKRRHTSLKTNVVSSEDCSIGEMVELLACPWVHRNPQGRRAARRIDLDGDLERQRKVFF
jgi:hypothetical protein